MKKASIMIGVIASNLMSANAAFVIEPSDDINPIFSRAQQLQTDAILDRQSDVPYTPKSWHVEVGKSLRETLEIWARRIGWSVHWDAKEDFHMMASARFSGEFESSVERLLSAVNAHGHAFRAEAYAGNKVLRVFQ